MKRRGLARTASYSWMLSSISSLQPSRAHSHLKLTGASSSPGHCPRSMPSLICRNTASLAPITSLVSSKSELPSRLRVLDHDPLEDVRGALGGVDRVLESLKDILPPDHDHRVDPDLEQGRDRLAHDPVGLVLQAMHLHGVLADVLEAPDQRNRQLDLARGPPQHPRQALRLVHRGLDPVEPEVVGDLLGVVDDVVEGGGQLQDVLAVDRRDERLVEPADDVMRYLVAVALAAQDVLRQPAPLGVLGKHLVEQVGGPRQVGPGALEQVEELSVRAAQEVGDRGHGGRSPSSIRRALPGRRASRYIDSVSCSRVNPSPCSSPATRTPSNRTGRLGANRRSSSSATGHTCSAAATGARRVRARVWVEKSSSRTLIPIVRPRRRCSVRVRHSRRASSSRIRSSSAMSEMSRSNVVSLDSDTTLRSWVTGESSSNLARRWSSPAILAPNSPASGAGGAVASSERVPIPDAFSRSTVFGPMPGTSPHGAEAKRSHACSRVRTTNPLGFSASEATLATSLLGPIPTEQLRPVERSISATMRRIAACGAGIPLRSM